MSTPPESPYGPSPYGPAQQVPTAPPPKKRRTWLIVLIVVLALFLLGIAGCVAILGTAAKSVSEGMTEAQQSQQGEADRNAPREVEAGKAFTIGRRQTLAGWKVTEDDVLGGFTVVGKVKNVSDETSTAFVHFKFLSASGEVLGNVECNSADLEPGQTQALNCLPDGKYGKYAKVTAEADF
jgi:hypothetical protein